jgi:hypothetical protein
MCRQFINSRLKTSVYEAVQLKLLFYSTSHIYNVHSLSKAYNFVLRNPVCLVKP